MCEVVWPFGVPTIYQGISRKRRWATWIFSPYYHDIYVLLHTYCVRRPGTINLKSKGNESLKIPKVNKKKANRKLLLSLLYTTILSPFRRRMAHEKLPVHCLSLGTSHWLICHAFEGYAFYEYVRTVWSHTPVSINGVQYLQVLHTMCMSVGQLDKVEGYE